MLAETVWNRPGPHQRWSCSASVQAANTSSRGASNTSTILTLTIFAMTVLLSQMVVQSLEPLLPEDAVLRDPGFRSLERFGVQPAVARAALLPVLDQPGVLEHGEVLRDGWQRNRERRRQLAHGRRSLREAGGDRASRRIGERGERRVERLG